ncbi:MAG TPA: hypothetical protein VHD85_10585 [Terracidiphilus sp.]|nr:hypothetical protein [Terracidiphilus sp.]
MPMVPAMWIVWCALVVVVAALKIYTIKLSRDEDDQIFLDESFEQEKTTQAAISAKLGKIEPYQRVALWVLAAATVFVIVYYIQDMIRQFH